MSPARRARILLRHGGMCARLGCEVTEDLEIDHFICLALGGRDTDDNLEPLCKRHHAQKTARDRKLIAKVNRLRDGKAPAKRPLRSRGFSRDLRKRIDGSVERRERGE